MRYYAIADLHGRYDILNACLDEIWSVNTSDMFKIITLGDYVDRGPESARIIQRLMDEQQRCPNTFVCLKGNHEDILLQAMSDRSLVYWWYQNGGLETVKSYGTFDIDGEHLNWMKQLPLYHATPEHIFVHAGIPDKSLPLDEQNHERLMWMLYDDADQGGWNDTHVVHGHHIHEDGPLQREFRTNLDTGSFYTNRQVIGVFDDTQGSPVDFIEVET